MPNTNTTEARVTRLGNLLSGARAQLDGALAAKAAGWTGTVSEPVDLAIERMRGNVARYRSALAEAVSS